LPTAALRARVEQDRPVFRTALGLSSIDLRRRFLLLVNDRRRCRLPALASFRERWRLAIRRGRNLVGQSGGAADGFCFPFAFDLLVQVGDRWYDFGWYSH